MPFPIKLHSVLRRGNQMRSCFDLLALHCGTVLAKGHQRKTEDKQTLGQNDRREDYNQQCNPFEYRCVTQTLPPVTDLFCQFLNVCRIFSGETAKDF